MDIEKVDRILEEHEYKHSAIISIMQDVQGIENYLPEETIRYISEKLELNLTRVFDIATFYKAFSLVPRGCHRIKVCCGTACHLAGAAQNLDQVERTLHIKEEETTDDRMFSIETVNCLGACALAPVVVVDKDYYDAVKPGKIEKILSYYHSESER
ncbi:MAG: NAD(P)H-dependent oxidoreductase subunit E [Desulfobacteraceae bacterium]|nr:NAD(P)H-dependent oxidoreductase subunit E [Pseudomonadota bacterium]MBU4463581.1 NAD(P)H-dependent oxidoreductase subunit E [Pseudomonadota bacterium]MCG2754864.1 NAD(P)H-dependent oxidoreductase subunit E [Desulfobacteraceae bacterium]